jgi:hypothetical protein
MLLQDRIRLHDSCYTNSVVGGPRSHTLMQHLNEVFNCYTHTQLSYFRLGFKLSLPRCLSCPVQITFHVPSCRLTTRNPSTWKRLEINQ